MESVMQEQEHFSEEQLKQIYAVFTNAINAHFASLVKSPTLWGLIISCVIGVFWIGTSYMDVLARLQRAESEIVYLKTQNEEHEDFKGKIGQDVSIIQTQLSNIVKLMEKLDQNLDRLTGK